MHCPHCQKDINDAVPECGDCGFHIRDLDAQLGTPPTRDGALCDLAQVLSEAGHQKVLARLRGFREACGHDFAVVTVQTTAPRTPAEYVFWLFNRWEMGGEAHEGLLVLLALDERRIECEVGIGLERALDDDTSTKILTRHAAPHLSRGSFDDGLYHGVDVLARIFEHAEGKR
jgi:uncharacterized protein